MTSITGTIKATERLNNSVNGNPRFRIVVEDVLGETHILVTSSDASCSYDVENVYRAKRLGKFTLTKAGRVSTIDYLT